MSKIPTKQVTKPCPWCGQPHTQPTIDVEAIWPTPLPIDPAKPETHEELTARLDAAIAGLGRLIDAAVELTKPLPCSGAGVEDESGASAGAGFDSPIHPTIERAINTLGRFGPEHD